MTVNHNEPHAHASVGERQGQEHTADDNVAKYSDAERERSTSRGVSWGPRALLSSFWKSRNAPAVVVEDTEQAPLLRNAPAAGAGYGTGVGDDFDAECDDGLNHAPRTTVWRELVVLAKFAWPIIFSATLQQALSVTSLVSVGKIGTVELGAVSLATMTSVVLFNSPVAGLSTSLDTLCAQAYGSGNKHLVGLQVQRMILFLGLFCIPVVMLFCNAGSILALVVPNKRSAELAGQYLRILAIGCPGIILYEPGKRFFQAQGLFRATAYSLLLAVPVNVFLNWYLVWRMGMGFHGAPLAVAISQLTLPLCLLGYVLFVDGSQCWGGFSKRALTNWMPMMRLAFPGAAQVCCEWIACEILTIMASQFGPEHLAAQTIIGCFIAVIFQPPSALGVATSTRMGQWIGAGKVNEALKSAQVGYISSWIIGTANMVILLFASDTIARIFTTDPAVLQILRNTTLAMSLMHLADALSAMAHSLIRGLGRQKISGLASAVIFWIVGVPISWYLAFRTSLELSGLWAGIGIALFLVHVIELVYCYLLDWQVAVEEAEGRIASN